ncbi:MAG: DUF1925 domain-containing protein [Gemmatimonadetes bacterium]|nr:DUF1925 domain-containing protein [Gemmatimonadota bacterium]
MSRPPVRFAFAIHLHQPIGNFDFVFREHVDEVYRPLLRALDEREAYPFSLHVSGPLLDWWSAAETAFIDWLAERTEDGRIEILTSGRYEPVLAALDRADRAHQLGEMRTLLVERFGVEPRGAWLTERVWEPDLAADLRLAGIEYTLLDDRHFEAVGLEREALDGPYETESNGHSLTLLSIDERLRYLIPFRPVTEIESFFRARFDDGTESVVLGDDGEKFGGWPDTRAWVWEAGWLDDYLETLTRLRGEGVIAFARTGDVAAESSRGLVYPATGSYREMEEWALPRRAAVTLADAWRRAPPEERSLLRGGTWKGFLTKYVESNRLHKSAHHISRLCRARGEDGPARVAVARAQCNDGYWHGVFGGVYLPHLRAALWRELAEAERALRADEPLAIDVLDWDFDGHDEVWVHSSRFSAVVNTHGDGAIQLLVDFAGRRNLLDVLTRRREPYHGDAEETSGRSGAAVAASGDAPSGVGAETSGAGVASVHDRVARRPTPPAIDAATLAAFQERTTDERPVRYELLGRPRVAGGVASIELRSVETDAELRKRYRFDETGACTVDLTWEPSTLGGGRVATSLGLSCAAPLESRPAARETRERIVTLARSERGFESIDQGARVRLAWPAEAGAAQVVLRPRGGRVEGDPPG